MSKNLEDIVFALANSAYRNRLVLFLGAGFSKAVMGFDQMDLDDHYSPEKARDVLSWIELLDKCRERLGLNPKHCAEKKDVVIDCPLEASSIVAELLEKDSGLSHTDAELELKTVVSQLVDWYPEPDQVCVYQSILEKINPAAIITTNYDEVVETILHKNYFSYGPNNTFGGLPNNFIPIYHIHGIRWKPDSILITREDYVQALRFSSYRQTRLACLLRENAVLYVGYGKNDINILSALDVARNAFSDLSEGKDNIHVQLLYSSDDDCRVTETDGMQYCVGIKDTYKFFDRISSKCESIKRESADSFSKFEKQYEQILSLPSKKSNEIVQNKRTELSKLIERIAIQINKNSIEAVQERSLLIILVQKLFDGVYGNTYAYGNFDAYDDSLFVLLELLVNMEKLGLYSYFFDFVAKHLEEIAEYIGGEKGQSWKAYSTLKMKFDMIPKSVLQELEDSAQIHGRKSTLSLLERVRNDINEI